MSVDGIAEQALVRRAVTIARAIVLALATGLLWLWPSNRPRTPRSAQPLVLTREMAEMLNHHTARFCDLDAHAGDEFAEVQRRLHTCVRRLRR